MTVPDAVAEVVGEMPETLAGKRAYFGFEPSGRLHRGILNPVAALRWLADRGATPIVLVADALATLNGKRLHEWDALVPHLPPNTQVFRQSDIYSSASALQVLLELAPKVTVKRALRAIDCAGRDMAADGLDGLGIAPLLYTMLQCVDLYLLDIDVAVGGTDQRKVHMLARDAFPRLGWKVPAMVHTKILLDRKGRKMSKSHPETCEWLDPA